MAVAQESTGMGKGRAGLLALLVIAGIAGAIHFSGGSRDEPAPKEYVDDDTVEVAPLVPASRMSGASWRSEEQVRDDREAEAEAEAAVGGESVLDKVEWSEDDESRAYDKSVEETVREIDGLGVYVAPAEGAKKEPAKKTPEPKKGAGK
ncbi:MAG: hypothetical protein ACHQ1G_09725 [Planctomycetota bacterium]